MGRYSFSSRQEADSLNSIDIFWLKKYGYLDGWRTGGIKWTRGLFGNESSIGIEGYTMTDEPYVRFFYTITRQNGEKKEMDYKIPLTTTPCNFGGERYWFVCPLSVSGKYCGRRVGTLYGGGDYYGCRHCYDLTYESRNLSGVFKGMGSIVSEPKLEKMESEIKREYYNGKMTKKYKSYLKKKEKAFRQIAFLAEGLYATKKIKT